MKFVKTAVLAAVSAVMMSSSAFADTANVIAPNQADLVARMGDRLIGADRDGDGIYSYAEVRDLRDRERDVRNDRKIQRIETKEGKELAADRAKVRAAEVKDKPLEDLDDRDLEDENDNVGSEGEGPIGFDPHQLPG
jgi:hypothetical protein